MLRPLLQLRVPTANPQTSASVRAAHRLSRRPRGQEGGQRAPAAAAASVGCEQPRPARGCDCGGPPAVRCLTHAVRGRGVAAPGLRTPSG
eukprot:123248-Chlamydomonas_euryale.AAC.2